MDTAVILGRVAERVGAVLARVKRPGHDPSDSRHYSQAACARIGKSLESTARMAWHPFCANERSSILSFSFASVERH